MSVARTVKDLNYDLTKLEQAARALGYGVQRNASVRGWAGQVIQEKADLVITSRKHQYQMGFLQDGKNVKMIADHHGGHVPKDMAHNILPRYLEIMLNEQRGRFEITSRKQAGRTTEIRVEVR